MRKKLFVCTQIRYAPNPQCCGNGGGMALIPMLTEQVIAHALEVDVVQSNCMLMCMKGPNIKLMPDGIVWNQASLNTIPEILNFLLNKPQ